MSSSVNLDQRKLKFRRLSFPVVMNLWGIVMVGKGILLMSKGAPAGIMMLSLGTLILVLSPWVQSDINKADPPGTPPAFWLVLMGAFAVYAFIEMINPFI
jgi:hypothetical protein